MIGYKGSENGKCINIIYEVGKTYEFFGELEICSRGFHFCKNIEDVNFYYRFSDKSTKIYKIEVLGDIIDENKKSITNKFKILEEIPRNKWSNNYKFDSNGNLIYQKFSNGNEWFYKYDENGNLIYKKDFNGEWFYKYDENGNLIYKKDFNGEWFYEYDENGNKVYQKDSNGYEYFYKYDENGNMIYQKDSNGYEWHWKYDENGNLIYKKDFNGEWFYEYDENGNKVYEKDSYGNEFSIKIT